MHIISSPKAHASSVALHTWSRKSARDFCFATKDFAPPENFGHRSGAGMQAGRNAILQTSNKRLSVPLFSSSFPSTSKARTSAFFLTSCIALIRTRTSPFTTSINMPPKPASKAPASTTGGKAPASTGGKAASASSFHDTFDFRSTFTNTGSFLLQSLPAAKLARLLRRHQAAPMTRRSARRSVRRHTLPISTRSLSRSTQTLVSPTRL
jgi:hypothetical protein